MAATRQGYQTDLTDEEWTRIYSLVNRPQRGPGPRRSVDLREVVNAILYKQRTGCQWRMLPNDLPPRSTVSGYHQRWKQSGVWGQICALLGARDRLRTPRLTSLAPTQCEALVAPAVSSSA